MIAPRPPDPTEEYVRFISWFLKHRTMISLSDKKLMKKFPHLDLENLVKTVGEDKVTFRLISSRGHTEKYILLMDLSWAQAWSEYYEISGTSWSLYRPITFLPVTTNFLECG